MSEPVLLRPEGVDLSSWEPPARINYPALRAGGRRFNLLRASYGARGRMDDSFLAHWHKSKEAGLVVGAYHYARPVAGAGRAQARALYDAVSNVGGFTVYDFGPILDLEEHGLLEPAEVQTFALDFLTHCEELTGRARGTPGGPMLYSGYDFLFHFLGDPPAPTGIEPHPPVLPDYPLWLAEYGYYPKALRGWKKPAIWQYSSGREGPYTAAVPGAGHVDKNTLLVPMGQLVPEPPEDLA